MTTLAFTPALQESWDDVAAELTSIPLQLERARYAAAIKPILTLSRDSRILEAGCGAGRILRTLEALGFHDLSGLEISQARLDYIARVGPASARLICTDKVPFDDSSFDAVISAAVIEHVIDPARWLGELARVTRPGGIVSIVTDTYIWKWLKMLGLYRSIQPLDEAIWPWRLASWARSAGLEMFAAGGFVNVPEQRLYFIHQLKRLTSMRRWWRLWRGVRRPKGATSPPCAPMPRADEVRSILEAVSEFPDSRRINMQACVWSYENYFWFRKA